VGKPTAGTPHCDADVLPIITRGLGHPAARPSGKHLENSSTIAISTSQETLIYRRERFRLE